MWTNRMEIAYLSLAAFSVGQRSRFDRCMLRPAPSTWWLILWHLLEGGPAVMPPFFLLPRYPLLCISSLALHKACHDPWSSWAELVKPGGSSVSPSGVLGELGCDCWSSMAALGKPVGSCRFSLAALGESVCDGWRP